MAADEAGLCTFRNLPPGTYRMQVFYMGQTFRQPDLTVDDRSQRTVRLRVNYNPIRIGEVVVTASESKSLSTASKIGLDAIRHIQPSSIADLLELLPGGRSSDPNFATPQVIRLREASPVGSNYNTSSLGTQFLIDGVPMSNDANLQSTPRTATTAAALSTAVSTCAPFRRTTSSRSKSCAASRRWNTAT